MWHGRCSKGVGHCGDSRAGQRRWTAFGRCLKRLTAQDEGAAGPTRVESHFRHVFERFGVASQLARV